MSVTPILRSGLYCLLLFLIIFSESCIKNENPTFPETEIVSISNITDTSVTAEGIISFAEIIPIDEYGFCWDTFRFKDRPLKFIKPVSDSSRDFKFKSTISRNLFKYKDHRISTYYIIDNDTVVSPSTHFLLFLEKRPIIRSINPNSATWGDTISIRGINFGYNKDSISIYLNGIQSELVAYGDVKLKLIVPDSLSDDHPLIELFISNKKYSEENLFRLLKPSFYDYSPKSFISGTVITLLGNNIPTNEKSIAVLSNNIASKIISYSDTSLKFIYPEIPNNSNPEIRIRTGISWHTISPRPNILEPKYTSFYPFTGSWGDTIFIIGSGFGTDPFLHSVYFGDIRTSPLYSCDTLIKVLVPSAQNSEAVTIALVIKNNIYMLPGEFEYIRPVVDKLFPTIANFGDTITITGNNFSNHQNEVRVEGTIVRVIYQTTDTIKFIIPRHLSAFSLNVSLKSFGFPLELDNAIEIEHPEIMGIHPIIGLPGDTISILGKNFNSIELIRVTIDGNIVEPISGSSEKLNVVVPALSELNSANPPIVVVSNNYSMSDNTFQLDPPGIISLSHNIISPGDTLIIKARNINYFSNSTFWFDGVYLKRIGISLKDSTYTCYVPSTYFYEGGEKLLTPTNLYFLTETISINYLQPYSKYPINTSSKFPIHFNQVFSSGGEILCGLGGDISPSYMLQKFSFDTESWTPLADLPFSARMKSGSFTIDDKFHLICGMDNNKSVDSSHYVYDILQNTWSENTSFPGPPRELPISFSINGKGYLGGGQNNDKIFTDLWEYNQSENIWTKISEIPGNALRLCSVYNDKLYTILNENELWRFDPANLNWTFVFETEDISNQGQIFVLNDNLLLYKYNNYGSKTIYKYNLITGILEKKIPLPVSLPNHSPLILNNIAYSIGGQDHSTYDCYILRIDI